MIDNDFPVAYRPDLDKGGYETLPFYPGRADKGFEFLKMYASENLNDWGGSPGQEVPREALERMSQPGTPPPADVLEEIKRKLGSFGVKQASSPSFEVAPDIDSPEVDRWVEEKIRTRGPVKFNPEDVRRNIQRLRPLIRGV
jgi:hypothetical protein